MKLVVVLVLLVAAILCDEGSAPGTGGNLVVDGEDGGSSSNLDFGTAVVCGGYVALGVEGAVTLESPNYPEEYQPNKTCIWRISGPKEYQLALTFQFFEVEEHANCFNDYVEIRDGSSLNSRYIGAYCGKNLPPVLKSTGNQLLVLFVSNGSVHKAGFVVKIRTTNETVLAPVEKPFYLQNPTTNMVLEIKGSSPYRKGQVVMWPYHGRPNQLWEYRDGVIYSKLNGLVLDVSGDDKRSLIMNAPHGGKTQKWTFDDWGTVQCETGKVLDIQGRSRDNGARVGVNRRTANWNQQFTKVYV